MNLGQCIANLLRQHPEVAVPGIGVFRKTIVSASFDGEQRVFLPPSSRIDLIDGEINNTALTDYLKIQRQISDSAATHLLEEKVRDLLAAIQRHGQVLLSGLGYLIADGAKVAFKPFETDGHLLRPIPELRLAEEEKIIADTVEYTTVIEEEDIIAEEEPIVEEQVEDEPLAEGRRSGRVVWWIAAAVLFVVLSAGGWAWLNRAEWFAVEEKVDEVSAQAGADVPGSAVAQSDVFDSVASQVDSNAGASINNAGVDMASTPVSAAAETPGMTYEIIVGSFATMRQAERYVSEMKAKGYEVEVIDSRMPGNRKKISWGSFVTEEEAYRELVRVQKNFEPDAWIAKVFHD